MRLFVLTIPLVLLLVFIVAGADDSSGETSWDYDGHTRILHIHSDVPDYRDAESRPWESALYTAERLEIDEGVSSVGRRAFEGSPSVQSVVLPGSLARIGELAFSGCTGLFAVTVPENVSSIGDRAFSDCHRLAQVRFEGSPADAGTGIFDGSSSLVDGFDLVYSSSSIPAGLFSPSSGYMVKIRTAELSAVRYVGAGAFRNTVIEDVSLPLITESVGESAFAGSSLRNVHIAGSAVLGNGVFSECQSLVNADIPAVNTIPESAFRSCTSLSKLTLSVRLVSVSDYAFSGSGIREVVLPGSLRSVGTEAFSHCSDLAHIAFTDSVYRIGDRAFAYCTSLATVELQSVSLPGSDLFAGCTSVERMICPSDSVSLPVSARTYTGFSEGSDVMIRYSFGSLDGGCTLFSDTVLDPSLIDGAQGRTFEGWRDSEGNVIRDPSVLTTSTELSASWDGDGKADGLRTSEIMLCVSAVSCVLAVVVVLVRRA